MSYSLPQVYKKPVSALYYLALYRNVDNMYCILIHGVIKLNLVITEVHELLVSEPVLTWLMIIFPVQGILSETCLLYPLLMY